MEIPGDFFCPISHEVMADPVITADGHSYERSCIAMWFALGNSTSPVTNAALESRSLMPNHALRKAIESFLVDNADVARKLASRHTLQQRLNALGPERAGPKQSKVDLNYIDMMTFSVMRDPVTAEDGLNYDRPAITRWIEDHKRMGKPLVSPTVLLPRKRGEPPVRAPMGDTLVDNPELKDKIAKVWMLAYPHSPTHNPEDMVAEAPKNTECENPPPPVQAVSANCRAWLSSRSCVL